MLAELADDNRRMAGSARRTWRDEDYGDVASTSLIEKLIDETERRVWFLFEATRRTA